MLIKSLESNYRKVGWY